MERQIGDSACTGRVCANVVYGMSVSRCDLEPVILNGGLRSFPEDSGLFAFCELLFLVNLELLSFDTETARSSVKLASEK